MAQLWPWLVIAGLGALHGSSPATGWMFAAACGVRAHASAQGAQEGAPVWRALLPIAIGHVAAIAVVACGVTQGLVPDRRLVQGLAGALLVGAAAYRALRAAGRCTPIDTRAGHAGLALWSFLMATVHGAGLMLVPAFTSLCLADNPAREITASGSLVLALGAVAVHTAAMLVTTGVIASAACRGITLYPRLLSAAAPRRAWTAALAIVGMLLMVVR